MKRLLALLLCLLPLAVDAANISGSSVRLTNPPGAKLSDLVDGGYDVTVRPGDVVSRGPVLDVRAYGAVVDTTSNDLGVALQAAHDALPSTGGTILIPAGTWYLSTPVTITKLGVVIQGMGIRATYLKPYSNALTTTMFTIGNAGGVTLQLKIKDLFVHGYTYNGGVAENWTGTFLDSTAYPLIDSEISNLWFSMSFSCPWIIKGGIVNSQIHHNVFELSGGVVYALGAVGVSVNNAVVSDNIFWRVLQAVKVDENAATATDPNLIFRNNVISTHYGDAAVELVSGKLLVENLKYDLARGTVAFAGGRDNIVIEATGGDLFVDGLRAYRHGGSEYAAQTWSSGDVMHVALSDASSNADVARYWAWECTTAGTSTTTPTWPASVTNGVTTVTSNGVVWTARSLAAFAQGIKVSGAANADVRNAYIDGAFYSVYSTSTGRVRVDTSDLRNGLYGVVHASGTDGTLIVERSRIENTREDGIGVLSTIDLFEARGNWIRDAGYGPQASQKAGIRARADTIHVIGNHFAPTATGYQYNIVVTSHPTAGTVRNNTKGNALGDVSGGLDVSCSSASVAIYADATAFPSSGSYAAGSYLRHSDAALGGALGWQCVTGGAIAASVWYEHGRARLMTEGATASVADGGTITHGLADPQGTGVAPTVVTAQGSVSGEFVSVTAKSATTFTVAIKKHDNSAGTTQTIYWRASK